MATNSMLKTWILVTRRALKIDFSKLEMFNSEKDSKIQFKIVNS